MNIFAFHGPLFMAMYIPLLLITFGCASWARTKQLEATSDTGSAQLDQYELATLNGGAMHAFLTALATLKHRQVIEVDKDKRTLIVTGDTSEAVHPLEKSIVEKLSRTELKEVTSTYSRMTRELSEIPTHLSKLGLMPTDSQEKSYKITGTLIMLFPVLFIGGTQLVRGIAEGHPVGFLCGANVVGLGAALYFLASKPGRTSAGDRVLQDAKNKNLGTKALFESDATRVASEKLAIVFALFGTAALAGSFSEVHAAYYGASAGGGAGGCGGGCGGDVAVDAEGEPREDSLIMSA